MLIPRLAPQSIAARLVLGLMPTVGILYAYVSPLIISALAQGSAYSVPSAALVFSANMYGGAMGGAAAIFLVQRVAWRPAVRSLVMAIFAIDLLCIYIHGSIHGSQLDNATALTVIRFCHGLAGGCLVGFSALVITRAGQPERTFALAVAIQLLLGGGITAVLSPWVDSAGVYPIWCALLVVTLLTLCLLPMLSDYPAKADTVISQRTDKPGNRSRLVGVSALLGLLLYQVGQLASYAYVFEIGQAYNFDGAFIGWTVALSLWVGVPSALFVAYWSNRSGRLLPSAGGALLTAGAIALLMLNHPLSYFTGNLLFGVFFSITVPYQLANISELDPSGRLASVGALVNSVGPASGPVLAALLISKGSFNLLLITGVVIIVCGSLFTGYTARQLDRRQKTP